VFTEGYWSLVKGNGLESTDYEIKLDGSGFTSFTFDSKVRILKRNSAASPWILDGTHVAPVGNVANRTGLSGFSEFALGSSSTCTPPITSLITGSTSVCTDDAGVSYSVIETPGSGYTWTITGGTVASGQGTYDITVNWGSAGMAGQVQVIENNGCADGVPVTLDVDIHPLPTSAISGSASVPENSTGVPYTVINTTGYTYNWTITGGNLASGAGSSNVMVDWGSVGAGNVRVVADATGGCGSDSPVDLLVTKYSAIRSIQTGDYDDPNTWDCTCVPTSADNVVIDSGHVVTMMQNEAANNLTINEYGTLDNQVTYRIDIYGNYTVNGTHAGAATGAGNERIWLYGVGTTIDGTGLITNSGRMRFRSGSKFILATADLVKPGGQVYVDANVVVTNQGSIEI
ncbi:hypothetical protein LCGC14_2839470, partial [marine sediment metagenome]